MRCLCEAVIRPGSRGDRVNLTRTSPAKGYVPLIAPDLKFQENLVLLGDRIMSK